MNMIPLDPKEITSLMKQPKKADRELVIRAFKYAEEAHKNQQRKSGEPYIIHPYNVALILADLGADAETISAGLLHDTVEDTGITLKNICLLYTSPSPRDGL